MLTLDTKKENEQDTKVDSDPAISKRLADMYGAFSDLTIDELEQALLITSDRREKIFYRTILNLKLQIDQEKVINQTLL